MTTASVLIYNSPLRQVECVLRCILRSEAVKIWVVYNGGNPAYEAELRLLCAEADAERVEMLTMPNHGYGAGHNMALRRALAMKSDFHLVANADTRWEGDALKPLIDYLETHPDTALVAPRTVYPDGELQMTARMLPSPAQLFLRRFFPWAFRAADRRYLLEDLDHSRPIDAPYLLGCFMLFRCEALRREGLFDERFFMYPEDIDITRRLHRRWHTLYLPAATIIHDHARESRHSLRMLRIHLSNMARYFTKWGWLRDPERRLFNRRLRTNA